MLVVTSEWFFHTLGWILYSSGTAESALNSLRAMLDLGIYFIPVGMLATLFLRGFPRVLVITAWLLMTVFMGHFYIA
jgi:hypothetical protein